MHLDLAQSHQLVTELDKHISASTKAEVVICPSFVALDSICKKLEPLKMKVGAQNCYLTDEGAFTGEVSPAQLRGLVDYVIVGHSERRLKFGETNDVIARKVGAVVRNGMTPIVCVGENLFERQDDETARVIHDQLNAALVMLTAEEVAKIVVAYEPVWAVDSDNIGTPEQIKKAVAVIRKTIRELFGTTAETSARVLYGGHMEPEFAQDFLNMKDMDGFLVGRASLNYHEFSDIVKQTQIKSRSKQGSHK